MRHSRPGVGDHLSSPRSSAELKVPANWSDKQLPCWCLWEPRVVTLATIEHHQSSLSTCFIVSMQNRDTMAWLRDKMSR